MAKVTPAQAEIASQAEAEAGTASDKFMTPERVQQAMDANQGIIGAWVKFSVSGGTVTVEDSFNVDSVTDNGVGDYTVNFTNDFANTHYVPMLSAKRNSSGSAQTHASISVATQASNPAVGACQLYTRIADNGSLADVEQVYAAFVGELA